MTHYMTHEFNIENRTFVGIKEVDRVHVHLNARCVEIRKDGVYMEDGDGRRRFIEADNVILATGLRREEDVLAPYAGAAQTVIAVGDCRKVGDLCNASSTGYYASVRI